MQFGFDSGRKVGVKVLVCGALFFGSLSFSTSASGLKVWKTVPTVSEVASTFTNRTTKNGLGDDHVWDVFAVGSTVYAATVGGLSISVDGGATFTNRTTKNGLGSNKVYGVFAVGSTVYAATSSGLSISVDGGATFTNRTTQNGLLQNKVLGVFAVGSTVYAGTEKDWTGGEWISGMNVSVDGGATFTNRTYKNGIHCDVDGFFAVGSTVYAATGCGLSISVDGGATFTNRTNKNGLGSRDVQNVFAVGSTVYAATSWDPGYGNGGLSISVDGGATFTNRTTQNGLGDDQVLDVFAVGSTVYAATAGHLLSSSVDGGGLSISVDGGATFTNRTTKNGLGSNKVLGVFAVGSTVYAATTGGLSISVNRPAPTVTTTLINRRFTENPYVPPLVFGEAVEVAKKNFKCPKVLILGFRGSGEQPIEFLEKDAGELLGKGQNYSNWLPKSGFKIPDKYAKLKYTTNSADLYPAIFGQTVGPHVKAAREQIAKIKGLKISEVGIWSVGVDDLEFSVDDLKFSPEKPPQSAYHAPAVTIKIGPYINQIQNTIKQFEGLIIERWDEKGAEINNFYYSLLLLKQFCPDLEGLYLIGYSQGAIAARMMAANSQAKLLVDGDLVDPNTGLPRRALFLIADPLFDGDEMKNVPDFVGTEPQTLKEMYPNDTSKSQRKYDTFRREKGVALGRIGIGCTPKFKVKTCLSNYSALQDDFAITTLCASGDIVCALSMNPWKLFVKGKTIHSNYYKNVKPQVVSGRICSFLRQPSCSG